MTQEPAKRASCFWLSCWAFETHLPHWGDVITEIHSAFQTQMDIVSNRHLEHAWLEKNNVFKTTFVCFGREIWSLLSNKLCCSLDCEQNTNRTFKSKMMVYLHITGISTGLRRLSTFIFKNQLLDTSQRPWKCSPNKQLNYRDGLDSALIILPPAREKWQRGESQQTRGSCQLPCLSKWFHERSAECVCLCWMFTDPNERTAKKWFLLT